MHVRLVCFVAFTFSCICLAGCTNPQSDAAQEETDEIQQALAVLRAAKTVDAPAVGYSGERTPTYEAFLILDEHASDEQLIKFLDDANTVVATYAFWALADRLDHEALFPLLMKQIKREDPVEMFMGCMMYRSKVGDEALDMVELTPTEQKQVTDYLLTTDNRLSARASLLNSSSLPEKYYERIRTLAQQGEPEALIALARFNREQDVDLILTGLNEHPFDMLRAITYFPHERFLPALTEYQKKLLPEEYWSTTQREFYSAVSKYRAPLAITILEAPLDEKRDVPMRSYHIRFVKDAIAAEGSRYHNQLRKRLNIASVD